MLLWLRWVGCLEVYWWRWGGLDLIVVVTLFGILQYHNCLHWFHSAFTTSHDAIS